MYVDVLKAGLKSVHWRQVQEQKSCTTQTLEKSLRKGN